MSKDTIYRQDVLHELGWCDYGLKDWQKLKLKTMVRDIPSAEPERRWIPCSERLPEKSGYYLCTMTEEHAQHPTGLEICEYDEDIEEFGFWYERFDKTSLGSLGSEWVELYVLAWTTLPNAYKAESEDKE